MIKKIFLILVIILLCASGITTTKATTIGNIIQGGDDFINKGSNNGSVFNDTELKDMSDSIYNILLVVGIIIAVIIGSILGIQFITGSVEQKAKVKDSLIPFVVGCVVIFGAFGIWKLVIIILR